MNKNLAIIGFGNQATAWALNLRDSGWNIKVGLREKSKSIKLCQELGFETFDFQKETENTLFAILTPDETHLEIIKSLAALNSKSSFIYAHGYSLTYSHVLDFGQDHILLAPKAIASELRFEYERKGKNGGVYSFEYLKDQSLKETILTIGKDLGLTSLHEASVKDETIADLFSEQTVLCSTLPYSALYSFNKLRQSGVSAEVAFFECWHEVKLIANTMVKLGPAKFFDLISPNALIGSEIGRSIFFDNQYEKKLEQILYNIHSGKFAKDLESVDFEKVKEEVKSFWEAQELTQVHKRLEKDLYQ
jgi:ketol-acid reductoisomerase